MSSGSHSWFDVAVVGPPGDQSNINGGTRGLGRWKSHNNGLAEARYKVYHGIFLGPDHDMWKLMEVGCRFAIFRCTETQDWKCELGALRVNTFEWYKLEDDI